MNVEPGHFPEARLQPVDLDLLRTFLAIVETGSFSRAAERVFRTPSAVSMQVKKLEEALGKPVFARDSRSVSLTRDGEIVLGYARRLLALSGEMMARFVTPEMEGTVTLGAPDDYGERIVPEVLKRFSLSHPNVQVNVEIQTSEQLKEKFRKGGLDVMLYTGAVRGQDDERSVLLLEEDLVWAGVKGGCAVERDPLPLSLWEEGCAWRANAVRVLEASGKKWRIAYMTAYTQAQRAAVCADLAIAPFPRGGVTEPMVVLGEKEGLPPLGTYAIRMRIKDDAGCCSQALADHVIACFEQHQP
jgi:DNA-binding transcriptional LysR family regulator